MACEATVWLQKLEIVFRYQFVTTNFGFQYCQEIKNFMK